MKSPRIFISYRRIGGLDTARNLYDRLVHCGCEAFMDLTSMRQGKFNTQIYEEIEHADNFVLVLSKGALDRCSEQDDWVQLEIAHALKHNKNIILVTKTDFEGFPANLPESISDIRYIDYTPISEEYYDAFFRHLAERIVCKSSSGKKRLMAKFKTKSPKPIKKSLFSFPKGLNVNFDSSKLPLSRQILSFIDILACLLIFFFSRHCNVSRGTIYAIACALAIFVRIIVGILLRNKDCRSIIGIPICYLLILYLSGARYFPFPIGWRGLYDGQISFITPEANDILEILVNYGINIWLFILPLIHYLVLFFQRKLIKNDITYKQIIVLPFKFSESKRALILIGALFVADILSMSLIWTFSRIVALSALLCFLFYSFNGKIYIKGIIFIVLGVGIFHLALSMTRIMRILLLLIQVGLIFYVVQKRWNSFDVNPIIRIVYKIEMVFVLLVSSCGYLPYTGINAVVIPEWGSPYLWFNKYEKIISEARSWGGVGIGVRKWGSVIIPPEFTSTSILERERNPKYHIVGDGGGIYSLEIEYERGQFVIYDAKQKRRLSETSYDSVEKLQESGLDREESRKPIYVLKKDGEISYAYFCDMIPDRHNIKHPIISRNLEEVKEYRMASLEKDSVCEPTL